MACAITFLFWFKMDLDYFYHWGLLDEVKQNGSREENGTCLHFRISGNVIQSVCLNSGSTLSCVVETEKVIAGSDLRGGVRFNGLSQPCSAFEGRSTVCFGFFFVFRPRKLNAVSLEVIKLRFRGRGFFVFTLKEMAFCLSLSVSLPLPKG